MKSLWPNQEKHYNVSAAFLRASEIATAYSGMDEFRKAQLWHLVSESAKLSDGDILEVGCGNGGSSLVIATSARVAGIENPIYLYDTFNGLVKADADIDVLKNGDMSGTDPEAVSKLMGDNGLDDVSVIIGVFPETWPFPQDMQFRFAHLDVDTYRSMKEAFEWVWPRLVSGGIIVVDDHGRDDCPGVTRFVEESLSMADAFWFLHGAGQAIVVKRGVQ